MLRKIYFSIFILTILLVKYSGRIYAQEPTVLIINQIRGNESCCQPGSTDLINKIKNYSLPFSWAFRFDALKNEEIILSLPTGAEIGLLLEITPSLASVSGVVYKGKEDGNDWYFAKNALLIGYSQEERKKLLDTLFETFKTKFGYYPSFTVSWMIDAWSLNYINSKYGVTFHELTKEQFETDSYTLYGGIFNAPYYPSKNHPLIPGYENKLNLVMVRQTISDLVYNYGSSKAYFTSQPNDYLENPEKKTTDYFKELLNNSLNQKVINNLSVVGFENSFDWRKYGDEFIKQLEIIYTLQKENKLVVKKPGEYSSDFLKNNKQNTPFFFAHNFSSSSPFSVLWYFGKTYRARVIVKDNKVILDDLRNFLDIPDPYKDSPATADYSYWIVPYLIDGSQQYSLTKQQEKVLKKKELLYGSTVSDSLSNPYGIILGKGQFRFIEHDSFLELQFTGSKSGTVSFNPGSIRIEQSLQPTFNFDKQVSFNQIFKTAQEHRFQFKKHFDFLIKPNGEELELGWINKNTLFPLFKIQKQKSNFYIVPLDFKKSLDQLYPIFQPDKSELEVDSSKSIFYWNNKTAIVGRNPVRLFLLPLNSLGRPTNVKEVKVTAESNLIKIDYPQDYFYRITPWFIDFKALQGVETKLSVSVDGIDVITNETIEFIPDCKKQITKCLTSGKYIIKYISTIFNEKKVQLLSRLPNL